MRDEGVTLPANKHLIALMSEANPLFWGEGFSLPVNKHPTATTSKANPRLGAKALSFMQRNIN